MVKICLSGFGKMNKAVYQCALETSGIEIVSILEPKPEKVDGVLVSRDANQALQPADVVVDFSTPAAALFNLTKAAQMGKNFVSGTTGLSPQQMDGIRRAVFESRTSGVYAPNFSIGVNVFIQAAKQLRDKLAGYEVEFLEVHHKHKKDVPSGTMLRLLKALEKPADYPVHALRFGDVVGDHSVIFAGNSERIELTHRATSRSCFAQGALLAAKWVADKKDGLLHEFSELL